MNSRTLIAGVVACALGAVAVSVGLVEPRTATKVAAAMPMPMPLPLAAPVSPPATAADGRIQIALLVDTSTTLDPARAQLWTVVSEYARATRHGRHARLEVALDADGPDGVQELVPFTADLDLVADRLFALRARPGGAPAGATLQQRIVDLTWSQAADDLRLVLVVGGAAPSDAAIASARARGIHLSAIAFGADEASLAQLVAPEDEELGRVREQLNAIGCAIDPSLMPFAELPAEMRLLDTYGQQDYLAERNESQARLQERLDQLVDEREDFIQAERARRGAALVDLAHQPGTRAGYRFE